MPNALDPSALDLDHDVHAPVSGDGAAAPSPGKRSLTQGLAPRSVVIMRVASDADADALAARLGARDGNGVAAGAHHAVDRAASSTGAPLRHDLRERFEHSLGADLSGVRVHTGGTSAEASRAVGARAYTVGSDIHFGAGQYAPDDPFGLHLLAHEVAHTVQQAGGAPVRQDELEVSTPDDPLEREADRAADAMVAGHAAGVTRGAGVQRLARETSGEMIDWWPAQEETAWDASYRRLKGKGTSAEAEFEASRDNGKVKAASAQSKTATKVKPTVTADQLQRIVSTAESETAARLAPMAGSMSAAFATMMIDTAQAQADYIAHMAGETGGKLEEVLPPGDPHKYAPFQGRGPRPGHPPGKLRARARHPATARRPDRAGGQAAR